MTLLEFGAAAIIAAYAMVGSAFISAAITSPTNTRKLIISGWQSIFEFLVLGLLFLAIGLAMLLIFGDQNGSAIAAVVGVATAHLALYFIFRGCRTIVEILLADTDAQVSGEDRAQTPNQR